MNKPAFCLKKPVESQYSSSSHKNQEKANNSPSYRYAAIKNWSYLMDLWRSLLGSVIWYSSWNYWCRHQTPFNIENILRPLQSCFQLVRFNFHWFCFCHFLAMLAVFNYQKLQSSAHCFFFNFWSNILKNFIINANRLFLVLKLFLRCFAGFHQNCWWWSKEWFCWT